MLRRYGAWPIPGQYYRTRPGVYAIIARGRDLLMTFQTEPAPEFQLPGGGIDPGESALPALHREVLEETGWSIGQARWLGSYRHFTFMPEYDLHAEKICHIYLTHAVLRRGDPLDALHTAIWLPAEEAAPLVESDGDRAFVRAYFGLR